MLTKTTPALALTGLIASTDAQALNINLISSFSGLDGTAEILAYTPDEATLLSTMAGGDGFGVEIMTLGNTGALSARGTATFDTVFDALNTSVDSASSTAADPLRRGFGAVSLIPDDNEGTPGKVAFFDYRGVGDAGRTLAVVDVGFHPDSITFSADGTKVYVANEGETKSGGDLDAPGSLSVIDLSSVMTINDVAGVNNSNVTTLDFEGVDLSALRFNDTTFSIGNAYRHVEPEYVSERDGKVYVSLQENNALAEFDSATNTWTAIHSLGTIEQTIDASDRDGLSGGTAAEIDDIVRGMPMPDAIATYMVGTTTYIVTANEGDFHPDDNDRIRVKDLDPAQFSQSLIDDLTARYGSVTDAQADENLGRLRVEDLDGVAGGGSNATYSDLLMPGTRSMSIWNAETGALVGDTGSLEPLLLGLSPELHNVDDGDPNLFDDRSPDKGPEPEALTVAQINNYMVAFVGLERQNGLLAFDITDPTDPLFIGYINSYEDGLLSPESLVYIPEHLSPSGSGLLIAGYEDSGSIGVYGVTVPLPATLALLGVGVVMLRRRIR